MSETAHPMENHAPTRIVVTSANHSRKDIAKGMLKQDLLIGTFVAALTVTLLSYANDVAGQRGDGSHVNQITKVAWLLTVWLNILSVFTTAMLDYGVIAVSVPHRQASMGIRRAEPDIAVIIHMMMACGIFSLVVGTWYWQWQPDSRDGKIKRQADESIKATTVATLTKYLE
ncbi:hypothetical protein BDV93DRAFT_549013 [Ceratobasidium sp. AG-I]|nr:hypothetical protein BDV93DRAFT_549013 [Ceratobasidium sp. AG-I]